MENTKPATSVTPVHTAWFSKYLKCFSACGGISENMIKMLSFLYLSVTLEILLYKSFKYGFKILALLLVVLYYLSILKLKNVDYFCLETTPS